VTTRATHTLTDFWRHFIREMPKVELHLHLEGAFTFPTLLSLIRKYGDQGQVRTLEELRQKFVYRDFLHFIETWVWKNQYFRAAEDFELAVYETLMDLRKQNLLYVEAFFSPWDFKTNGLGMEEITEAVLAGCTRASRDCGIRWRLIADINREHGPDAGLRRIEQVRKYKDRGVIGIGLGGREREFPAAAFAEVYAEAAHQGLFCTAHAGEADGARSVRAALEQLHVHRVGHGVRAVEDPHVVSLLKRLHVPLEICVTSNVMTGVVPSPAQHPLRKLFDAGLTLTINTDDPTMFGCTLSGEFQLLLGVLGFSPGEIRSLCLNAVNASTLAEEEKAVLKRTVEQAWASVPLDAWLEP